MKRSLPICLFAAFLFSCSTPPPKESARQFIEALHKSDFTTASNLTSSHTRVVLEKASKETKQEIPSDEAFQLTALKETVSGEQAEVKNDLVSLMLVKEDGSWKVALDEKLLLAIQGRESVLAELRNRWDALQKEYEGKVTLARDYINYKKSLGELSPKAKALDELLDGLKPEKSWTKETLLAYVQKQQALTTAIDNALEPSLAANTDLTMNYFLQLNQAASRVKAAEAAYQLAADKAQSATFVRLPVPVANTLQVQKN